MVPAPPRYTGCAGQQTRGAGPAGGKGWAALPQQPTSFWGCGEPTRCEQPKCKDCRVGGAISWPWAAGRGLDRDWLGELVPGDRWGLSTRWQAATRPPGEQHTHRLGGVRGACPAPGGGLVYSRLVRWPPMPRCRCRCRSWHKHRRRWRWVRMAGAARTEVRPCWARRRGHRNSRAAAAGAAGEGGDAARAGASGADSQGSPPGSLAATLRPRATRRGL